MENKSPFLLVKDLERQLSSVLAAIDVYALAAGERKLVTMLKRELADARLDIRDYELSETRDEQLAHAKEAKARLGHVRKYILAASEHNIFSAVDVAEASAHIEQIMDYLG